MTGAERPLPAGMPTVGRLVQRLLSLGFPMGPLHLLRTRGRNSGIDREVPIVVLDTDGCRWLVAPFGDVAWVRNVRTNGEAHLRRGANLERVHLEEIDDTAKAALLRMYRRRFAPIPFVRAAFDATGRDPVEAFTREAHHHPVFRMNRESAPRDGQSRPEDGTTREAHHPDATP